VDDPGVVSDLLTSPSGEFTVDRDDPLGEFVGPENAARLALAGILTVEALAEVGEGDLPGLARETGESEGVLDAWIEAARVGAPEVRAIEVLGDDPITVHPAEFYRRFRQWDMETSPSAYATSS
jgi:hypothetical protein